MLQIIYEELLRGFDYFSSLGFLGLVTIFWHFFYIDLPRYLFADLLVLLKSIVYEEDYSASTNNREDSSNFVTVIVPTFNREKTILNTIRSLKSQTYKNFEIIVSDDGSSDKTVDVCQPFADRGEIVLIKNEYRGGKASALNHALHYSKGNWIVQIDSDSSFDRNAIAEIIAPLHNEDIGAVSGNIRVRNSSTNLLTEMQNIEYLRTISVGRRFKSEFNILSIVSGAFGAFKKDLLNQVKGWELGPGDDSDITIKTRKMKKRIFFAHRAICMTDAPETIQAIIKQRLRWNRSLVKNRIRKHVNIFNPFYANFSLTTVIAFVDQLYYQVLRGYSYVVYLFYVIIYMPELLLPIFTANFFLYTTLGLFESLIVLFLSERKKQDLRILIYLPIFTFYKGLFLRTVRLIAYLDELINRRSYTDSFVPKRVGAIQIKW